MISTPARRTAGVLAAACVAALALTACQNDGPPPSHDTAVPKASGGAPSTQPANAPSTAPSQGNGGASGGNGGDGGKINLSAFLTPERIPLYQQYRWEYGQPINDQNQAWLWFEQRCQSIDEQLSVALKTEALDITPTTGTKSPSSAGTSDFKGRATIGVPRDAVQGGGLADYLFRAVSGSLKACKAGKARITYQSSNAISAVVTFPGGKGTLHEYIVTPKGRLSELSLWDAPSSADPEHVTWPSGLSDKSLLDTLKTWLCTNQGCS